MTPRANQDLVFAALGDPTRREIVQSLSQIGTATATGLAGQLDMTRQAVSKHLGILADAGLARSYRQGRETRFEAQLEALDEVRTWVAQVESEWTDRLALLAAALEKE